MIGMFGAYILSVMFNKKGKSKLESIIRLLAEIIKLKNHFFMLKRKLSSLVL